jgi:Ca-activated chloride channel homolog
LLLGVVLSAFSGVAVWMPAQENKPDKPEYRIAVDVEMVQLNVAVTDNKGNYLTGLRPNDFAVLEDGIREKIATFGEENEVPRRLADLTPTAGSPPGDSSGKDPGPGENLPDRPASPMAGAKVFILFDTSNYMYRGFVFAQDAICEFVRSLDRPDRVAFYSYSRDFSRASLLTPEKMRVLRGVRATVAGDDAALYDALLMTVKDAERFSGKRVVVVFSNGPDNASMVAPEDVRELAESEGIPIYMISTQQAKLDPISTAVFERMSATTGGKAYFAKNWREQQQAFASIREDLAHLYSLSYYPQVNPNRGWRRIMVKLEGQRLQKYHIRTRSGYRPQLARAPRQVTAATEAP